MEPASNIPQEKDGEKQSASGKIAKLILTVCVLLAILLTMAVGWGIWGVVIFIVVTVLCLIIIAQLRWHRTERLRIQAFQELAGRLGMSYSRKGRVKGFAHPDDLKAKKRRRRAFHIFEDNLEGHRVRAFKRADSSNNSVSYSCFTLEQEGDFPLLAIEPVERQLDRLDKWILRFRGIHEIDLAGDPVSDRFSQAFRVMATEEEFARAFCQKDMMEYLLHHPDCALNVVGNSLTLTQWKDLEPDGVESGLRQLAEIYALIPAPHYESFMAQWDSTAEKERRKVTPRKIFQSIALALCLIIVAVIAVVELSLARQAVHGHTNVVRLMLTLGADPNARYYGEGTALMAAAMGGHTDTAKVLLRKGADVNAMDDLGMTALMWAAYNGHDDVIKLLLDNGANLNAKNNGGETALHAAVRKGHDETLEFLLENGADVNATDDIGMTALIYAAWKGHTAAVKILLENGADVNASENHGVTALMVAAMGGHLDTAKVLMENGADITMADKDGDTALSQARRERHTKIIRLLKRAGATQ